MTRFLPTLLILVVLQVVATAQQLPLYTQYVFNPYMVNPSMVAASNRSEVNLFYRQQWTALTDGPKTLQFDAQYALNGKMGLGLQVVNDKTVLLSATSAMVTYGYRVSLATDHILGFGLSAGMYANRVDLNQVAPADLNDPALLGVKNNNIAMDGQFGMHYRFKNFLFGASLVNIFDRKTFTAESFQKTKLSQLKNDIFFASYRFTIVPEQFYFQPNFAYRMSTNNTDFYEASGIISFKNIVDVGGGYRQNFGPTTMIRVNLGDFQAGFAYDFPSGTAQISPGGTREVQIKWRFGKTFAPPVKIAKVKPEPPVQQVVEVTPPKEEEKKPEPVKEEVKQEPVVVVPEPVKEEPKKEEPKVEVKTEPVIETPVVKQEPVVVKQEPPVVKKKPAYSLIAGTYKQMSHAERTQRQLQSKGIKAEIRATTDATGQGIYYVLLPDFAVDDVTLDKVMEVQKATGVQDAWYKKLD